MGRGDDGWGERDGKYIHREAKILWAASVTMSFDHLRFDIVTRRKKERKKVLNEWVICIPPSMYHMYRSCIYIYRRRGFAVWRDGVFLSTLEKNEFDLSNPQT